MRVLSYLTWPLLMLGGIIAICYYITPGFEILSDKMWLSVFSIGFSVWSVPTIFLLYNHYRHFRRTVFQFDDQSQEFYLTSGDQSIKFPKHDIVMITQYNARTGSISWSDIYIWEIKTRNETIVLAPIVVSKSDFRKIFAGSPIEYKHKFFVSV